MKRLFFLLLMSAGIAFAAETVDPAAAEKLIADDVQVLDVRTEGEWKEGTLEDAVRINWYDKDFAKDVKAELKTDKPVLVYCRSGGRSAEAAEKLEELGFKTVYDLDGGILAWEKAGKKVVK